MNELRKEKDRAIADLADARRRLRNAQHRAAAAERKRKRQWRFSNELQRAALILYDKGHPDASAATAFLMRAAAHSKWEERPEADVRELVETGTLTVPFASTCDNYADLFTKPLDAPRFLELRRLVMNIPLSEPATAAKRVPDHSGA